MSAIQIIILTITGLFTLFILRKKNKRTSDYLLIAINLASCFGVFSEHWAMSGTLNGIKLLLHFSTPFWFISLFLLWVYSLIEGKGSLVVKWWFFTFSIPFFLFTAYDLLLDGGKSEADYKALFTNPSLVYHFFFKAQKVFIIIVGFVLLKQIKKYQSDLKASFSSLEHISLHWLRNYIIFIVALFFIHLVTFLLYNFGWFSTIDTAYYIFNAALVVGVFYISFYGIQQYNIPSVSAAIEKPVSIEKPTEKVAEKSQENEEVFAALKTLFETEQYYTDPQLRVATIAAQMNVPAHKISQAINEQYGKPFYDFVAGYRVNLLQEKLRDPKNASYTILSLAMDAGFNSKASLNRIFKEHTGMTPSQYQKSHIAK